MKTIKFKTTKKFEMVDITPRIKAFVKESGIKDGWCNVYTPHATSGIIINENYDPQVMDDIIDILNKLVPEHGNYRHDRVDGNAQAHLKAAILPTSQVIPVQERKLQLGQWQAVVFAELDGPRNERTVWVSAR